MIAFWLLLASTALASPISSEAKRNFKTIDALDVEHHWLAGAHVAWDTGVPDGVPVFGNGKHSHCSVFAATAARALGIYLLHPPEHAQEFLANDQAKWLASDAGKNEGWKEVSDGVAAQEEANKGSLVVAVYDSGQPKVSGHIAIVRPSTKSNADITAEGPEITQAGATNYVETSLEEGFANHPKAFENHEVRFFRHAVTSAPR